MKNNEKLAEKIIASKDNPLELLAIIIELEREEKELKQQVRKLKEQNSLIRKLQSRGDALPPPPLAPLQWSVFQPSYSAAGDMFRRYREMRGVMYDSDIAQRQQNVPFLPGAEVKEVDSNVR
jgi:hypothetical protein